MRKNRKNKNNIIIGLCTVLILMAVGFGAFSQSLQISDTSGSTTTWNVYISNAELASNSSNATGSVTKAQGLEATFATTLHSPGDIVVYNVTVTNDGSVDATLDEINLNATNSDSVILYSYSGIANGDTLSQGESKTFTVTVEYDSTKTGTATESQKKNSATLQLNFIQGNGAFNGSSNVVYRDSTDSLSIGDSIEGIETTTDPSTLGQDQTNYLKHEIDSNNLITASYLCFVTDAEYCLKGGDTSAYQSNVAILQANEDWFTNEGGSCSFGDTSSACYGDSLKAGGYIAYSSGNITTSYLPGCQIDSNGISQCYDMGPSI